MAPSSAKAQIINKLQKVEQRKMKKTKTKKKKQESSVVTIPSKTHHHELGGDDDDQNMKKLEEEDDRCSSGGGDGGCCTPKAERFKIPDILSCPSAPKKMRVIQNYSSSIRSPIAFFSSPDIDLFFSSLGNLSA